MRHISLLRTISYSCFLFFIYSCETRETHQESFVSKYNSESFDVFKNKGFVIRGYDEMHNPIVFISYDLKKSFENSPYMVICNKNEQSVIETGSYLIKDTSLFNKLELNKLALKFLTYNISLLQVDIEGNVFIGMRSNEMPDLARLHNYESLNNVHKIKWKRLRENWYISDE